MDDTERIGTCTYGHNKEKGKAGASVELNNLTAHWKKQTDEGESIHSEEEHSVDEKTPLLTKGSSSESIDKDRNGEAVLKDLNLEISGEKLLAIVGPVGSSKVSLTPPYHTRECFY